MQVVEFDPDDPALADALKVLCELRPHLDLELLRSIYHEGWPQGLRFTALYEDDRCVAVAGWRVIATTSAERKLYVDDLVTASGERSRGYGRALLADLEDTARNAGCRMLDLDSGIQRTDAHRFYQAQDMTITSYHFGKPLT
jgi:GNAT superfamily N-acetyltransferase